MGQTCQSSSKQTIFLALNPLSTRNVHLTKQEAICETLQVYCSTVWSNTSNSNIDKLQKVQNFAGRIILGLRKYDHISDGLRSLKWLPIREKLILNDATMMHKCINKLVPDYLADMFKLCSHIIDKLDRQVLWTYPYVACQQGSALLLSEEPNSGIL